MALLFLSNMQSYKDFLIIKKNYIKNEPTLKFSIT